jgi:limonene 1,2-monooxygenase
VVALDRLGFDEVWFGEHHSAGYELIASPEVMIAIAAERTKHIKLGTGVVSLPYHHPLMVADRIVLLDHLTRGRVIFGVGPGALPTDAWMMGIDPVDQRRRMEESLEAIVALLTSDEPVSRETDWFTLRDARLQLRPYTHPHFEIAVAAMFSPSGPKLAGRFGASLLSLSATSMQGYAAVGSAWKVVEDEAAKSGSEIDRRNWRLVGPMHVAETKELAEKEIEYGLADFQRYFGAGGGGFVPLGGQQAPGGEAGNGAAAAGMIGTPKQAIAAIEELIEHSGGFGTYLFLGHDWADREATLRSYELIAREVVPYFKGQLNAAAASNAWAIEHRGELFGRAGQAVMKAITDYTVEKEKAGG